MHPPIDNWKVKGLWKSQKDYRMWWWWWWWFRNIALIQDRCCLKFFMCFCFSPSVSKEDYTTIANVNFQYIYMCILLCCFMPNYLWLVRHIAPHNVLCCMHPHRKVLLWYPFTKTRSFHFTSIIQTGFFFSGSSLFLSFLLHTLFNTFFYPSFDRFAPSSTPPLSSSSHFYISNCALVSVLPCISIKCFICI